jgi:YD repeat-containing protein
MMSTNTEPERSENVAIVVALALATVLSVGMIVLMLLGVVRASAEPQTRTFYNDRGQVTGTAMTRGNTTTFSNERGQSVGRAGRRPDGTTNFYDDKGRIIGTSRAGSAR